MSSGRTTTTALPLGAVRTDEGDVVVPESRRADGSVRKPIRIRQGYVPQDEVPKYKPVGQRMREQGATQKRDAPSRGDRERTVDANADAVAEELQTLSLTAAASSSRNTPSTAGLPDNRGNRDHHQQRQPRQEDRSRPQSPSRPASASAESVSSARELKTELSTINKTLREIAKLDEFATAAAHGDAHARPLTAAQKQKAKRRPQLEARRGEIIALLESDSSDHGAPSRANSTTGSNRERPAPAKPTTLRVIEL